MVRAGMIALLLMMAAGCARRAPAELQQLRQRMEELAQRESESQRRIEELNNRLFLLEDKVDTGQVAQHRRADRAPRLPVIRIRPEEDDEPQEEVEEPAPAPSPESAASSSTPLAGGAPAQGTVGRRRTVLVDEVAATAAERDKSSGSLVEFQEVRYRGAATKDAGPRPVLRLTGAGGDAAAGEQRRESGAAAGPDPATVREKLPVVPLPARSVVRSAMGAYNAAMSEYKAGRYNVAASAFRRFLGSYGKHAYADNALYWLGECFYDLGNYRVAVQMFRRVVKEFPTGNKAPDALLKMGYAYLKLQERDNARSVLAQVVDIFPKSNVADMARQTLSKLQ